MVELLLLQLRFCKSQTDPWDDRPISNYWDWRVEELIAELILALPWVMNGSQVRLTIEDWSVEIYTEESLWYYDMNRPNERSTGQAQYLEGAQQKVVENLI